jgi:hypothetical protein
LRLPPPERAIPMAVAADDIALCSFFEDRFGSSTPGLRDVERLLARIPMIELHRVARKAESAVVTWSIS